MSAHASNDTVAVTRKRFPVRRRRGALDVPWLLLAPALVFVIGVHWAAPLAGAFYAFTDWTGIANAHWIGLQNFRSILHDPASRAALEHTLILGGAFFILVNGIGLLLALGLNRAVKSRNFLRSLFFLPVAMSPLATAYIWQYIFDYNGALNGFLRAVGSTSSQRAWLGQPTLALCAVVVVVAWQYSGLAMVVYLAGLQGIPEEIEEAALVDGAGTWRRFRRITFPLLAPAVTVNAILTVVIGMRIFDQVIALTFGGPNGATETLATQVYKQTFEFGRFGYGAALALVLAVIVAVLVITLVAILRRREVRI